MTLKEIKLRERELRQAWDDFHDQKRKFEDRMRSFRKVCTVAWDAAMAYKQNPTRYCEEIDALYQVLEKTDSLWEGYAGCAPHIRDLWVSARCLVL